MSGPIGRKGQSLAAGIGVLSLATLWFGVVDPLQSWYNDRAALLEQRRALLHRMQAISASLPAMRAAAVKHNGASPEPETTLLTGATDAVAAADLQDRVQKMAAAAGITLTAVETLPAQTTAGHWHKVSLRISLTAGWPVLINLIQSAEQSPTRIFIDDVHLHSPVAATYSAGLPIQASMVLYGFRPA